MLTQLSLLDTDSFTSSPASADGPLQPVLPDGPTTASLSPGRARVSRSRSRAKEPVLLMHGTYGPTFSESSVPDGPLSSWESRLRLRLAKVGSSECDLTWKVSGTTAEGLLSRLVPSTPRTVEIDSGLLLEAGYWVTCTTRDHKDTPGMSLKGPDGRDRTDQLPRPVAATLAAYWSTPRASDGEKGGPNQAFGAGGQPLPARAYQTATWATCRANEGTGDKVPPGRTGGLALKQEVQLVAAMWPSPTLPSGGQTWPEGTTLAGRKPDGTKAQVTLQNVASAMWPTATATDGQRGAGTIRPQDTGIPLPQRVALVTGTVPAGSSATTGKRGVLNPQFPCWLMGYPTVWVSCGASAMQSLPRSRRK